MHTIVHTKSPAKLHYFIELCKRLQKKNKNIVFYMFYSIILRGFLVCVKKK